MRVQAKQAEPLAGIVADVERGTLRPLRNELPQNRHHAVVQAVCMLVGRPQSQERGTQMIAAIQVPLYVTECLQGGDEPKQRTFVEPRPLRERRKRERLRLSLKRV